MEFLRFGSSIPGAYFGCCAVDIIQQMNCNPDAKASIQVVDGDSGSPIQNDNHENIYLGKTNREVFLSRLRIGTFADSDMPNHGFLVVLTADQIRNQYGKKWLAILKEQGFEFIRCIDNSVYTGEGLAPEKHTNPHKNYIFGLFRNVGAGTVEDQFTPPKEWTDLPSVVPEAWQQISDPRKLTTEIFDAQLPLYNALTSATFYTAKELTDAGVTPMLAGVRSDKPPRPLETKKEPSAPAPFSAVPAVADLATA